MIDIGALTDVMLTTFTPTLLVGDGVAPKESGWTKGSPNIDRFVACTVIGTEGAVPALDGLLELPEWEVTVSLRHYGGTRQQCDYQAHAARVVLMTMRDKTFGSPAHKVIGIRWRTLGGLTRIDQTDPPFWQSIDSVALMCDD